MSQPAAAPSTLRTIATLAERIRQLEVQRQTMNEALVTSGSAALDELLPEKAFRRGTLVEWLAGGAGSGAATLALMAAREACRQAGALAVVDRQRLFYPPAAASLGVDLKRLIVVRAASARDDAWAFDQALRSPGVAAALCWPEKLKSGAFRRLQLAAESSGALGLLVRSERVRAEPCWAELRLLVRPLPSVHDRQAPTRRRLQVELLRSRGGLAGANAIVELIEGAGAPEEKIHVVDANTVEEHAAERNIAGNVRLGRSTDEQSAFKKDALRLGSAVASGAPRRRSTGA